MIFLRKTRKRKIELEQVHKTRGHIFYSYKNNLELPAKRSIAAEVAVREACMNITAEKLDELLDECIKHANKGNIVDLFAIIKEIKNRLRYSGERETLMKLATVYYIMDNEDETDYIRSEQQAKMKFWEDYPEEGDFFLQKAHNIITSFSNTSQIDIVTYLMENEKEIKKLQSYLHTD